MSRNVIGNYFQGTICKIADCWVFVDTLGWWLSVWWPRNEAKHMSASCMTHTPTTNNKHLPPLQKQMSAVILKRIGRSPTVLDSIKWLNMTLLHTTPLIYFDTVKCMMYSRYLIKHTFLFTSFSTEMHATQCSYGILFCSYDADFSIRHLNSSLKTLFTELVFQVSP